MLFVDDIVLVVEPSQETNIKLEQWMAVLKGKKLHICHAKTKYMRCNFSGIEQLSNLEVTIGQDVDVCTINLSSIIQRNKEIIEDVTHQLQVYWLKGRKTTRMLCDKKFSTRLIGYLYRVSVRSILLRGKECQPVKKSFDHK